jgi:hypothetical protein
VSLPEALEAAATALPADADAIRPANGDPFGLLEALSPEAAERTLAWLFANRADDAEELAHAWEGQEAGAKLLAGLDEKTLPKAGRKIVRKVKHRLRSRGVEVSEEAPEPKVAALAGSEEELSGAWLTPLDPSGARMAVLVEANPSGGARLFEVILDDERGILSFNAYTASRGKVRRFVKGLAERGPHPAVAVSGDGLRAVVAHALAAHPSDRSLPKGFGEWRSLLAEAAEGALLPGDEVRGALGSSEGEGASLESAVELVEQGRVGPWPPGREVLTELLDKIRTALESPLIVSGATRREQLDQLLAEGAAELLAGERAGLCAHRFREAAHPFWKKGDESAARACLAAAEAFDAGAPDNPVALAMLRVPMLPAVAQLELADGEAEGDSEAPDEESESLIVTP